MSDYLPWIVMVLGVFALLVYGFFSGRGRYLYALTDFSDKESIVGVKGDMAGRDILIEDRANAREMPRRIQTSPSSKEWMPVVISILVLLSALYVILSNTQYADSQQKWAFGAVGTILGYWFKK